MADSDFNQLDNNRKPVVNNEYTRLKEKLAIMEAQYMNLFNEKQGFVVRYSQYWLTMGSSKKYQEIYAYYRYLLRVFEQGQDAKEKDTKQAENFFFDDSFYGDSEDLITQDQIYKPKTDSPQKLEIRTMYKHAAKLCHPDKLPESLKEQGQKIFVELSIAYRNSNYPRIKELYDLLTKKGFVDIKLIPVTLIDELREKIISLETLMVKTQQEINKFKKSPYYKAVFSGQFPDFTNLYYSIKYMQTGIEKIGNIKSYKKKNYPKYTFKSLY